MQLKILAISNYNSFVSSRPEAEVFLRLKQLGATVEIITKSGSEHARRFEEAGIKVHGFHPESKFDKAAVSKIRQILIEGEHDILHLFNSKAIITGLKASKGLPVKTILYRGYTGNIHWYDPTIYLKYLHPRVDAIWCNAEAIRQLFCKQWTFDCKKAKAINKGHLPEWYNQPEEVDIRKELNIPSHSFVVVCVANARKMKGMKYLTESANYIPKDLPIHYIYIGNGLDTPEVKSIQEKSSYKDNFHFLGYREDALGIVKSANCFALASITGESITKALIESMSLGCPPVATDISGNKELLIHEQTAIVVRKKDSQSMAQGIMTMYNNPTLRAQISKGAQNHIATHIHSDTTVKKLLQLYKELNPQLEI